MGIEFQVTFDSADPAAHAAFWAEALHYDLQPPPPGFDSWDAALEAECTRLVALGASRFRRFEPGAMDAGFIVMRDPEGNEFCLD